MSYSEARAQLASTMQQVCDNHDPIIITRANSNSVVMMSLEDYESIVETHYLLSSPKNAEILSESMDEVEAMIAKKKAQKRKKQSMAVIYTQRAQKDYDYWVKHNSKLLVRIEKLIEAIQA